jgi:hypothetical protein
MLGHYSRVPMPPYPGGDHDSGHEYLSTSLKCGGIYLLNPFKFGLFMWQNLVLGGRTDIPTHIYILENGDSSAGRVLHAAVSFEAC